MAGVYERELRSVLAGERKGDSHHALVHRGRARASDAGVPTPISRRARTR